MRVLNKGGFEPPAPASRRRSSYIFITTKSMTSGFRAAPSSAQSCPIRTPSTISALFWGEICSNSAKAFQTGIHIIKRANLYLGVYTALLFRSDLEQFAGLFCFVLT